MSQKRRASEQPSKERNGSLRIPLSFEDALKAATEVGPPEKPPKSPRKKPTRR